MSGKRQRGKQRDGGAERDMREEPVWGFRGSVVQPSRWESSESLGESDSILSDEETQWAEDFNNDITRWLNDRGSAVLKALFLEFGREEGYCKCKQCENRLDNVD